MPSIQGLGPFPIHLVPCASGRVSGRGSVLLRWRLLTLMTVVQIKCDEGRPCKRCTRKGACAQCVDWQTFPGESMEADEEMEEEPGRHIPQASHSAARHMSHYNAFEGPYPNDLYAPPSRQAPRPVKRRTVAAGQSAQFSGLPDQLVELLSRPAQGRESDSAAAHEDPLWWLPPSDIMDAPSCGSRSGLATPHGEYSQDIHPDAMCMEPGMPPRDPFVHHGYTTSVDMDRRSMGSATALHARARAPQTVPEHSEVSGGWAAGPRTFYSASQGKAKRETSNLLTTSEPVGALMGEEEELTDHHEESSSHYPRYGEGSSRVDAAFLGTFSGHSSPRFIDPQSVFASVSRSQSRQNSRESSLDPVKNLHLAHLHHAPLAARGASPAFSASSKSSKGDLEWEYHNPPFYVHSPREQSPALGADATQHDVAALWGETTPAQHSAGGRAAQGDAYQHQAFDFQPKHANPSETERLAAPLEVAGGHVHEQTLTAHHHYPTSPP